MATIPAAHYAYLKFIHPQEGSAFSFSASLLYTQEKHVAINNSIHALSHFKRFCEENTRIEYLWKAFVKDISDLFPEILSIGGNGSVGPEVVVDVVTRKSVQMGVFMLHFALENSISLWMCHEARESVSRLKSEVIEKNQQLEHVEKEKEDLKIRLGRLEEERNQIQKSADESISSLRR
ncbi:hypothetical protein HK098_001662 [Nowakowskiella sp. JEL0407]|nr:hypothetical protein HK098_001662 [Nowakowskiella sp. JEL0407]